MKILYIDHFSSRNSNGFWKTAFERVGSVQTLEIAQTHPNLIIQTAIQFQPDHIHLGGSVKHDAVPLEALTLLRRSLGCGISHFYGDAAPSEYHLRTARTAFIYMSVYTYVEWNQKLGVERIAYMPCPTDPELFQPYDVPKIYDVVFIGNHYSSSRIKLLQAVSRMCSLMIYGEGWDGSDLPHKTAVYGEDFAGAVSEAKLVLSLMSDEWVHLKRCFSNRLINSLSCGACVIQTRTPDIESVFQDRKHLLLYEKPEELLELIAEYLPQEEEQKRIGATARSEIGEKYSYDRAVRRILDDGAQMRAVPQKKIFPTSNTSAAFCVKTENPEDESLENSPKMKRLTWVDAVGPLPTAAVSDLMIDVELLPKNTLARLDTYAEMNRLCRAAGMVILPGDPEKRSRAAREITAFGFRLMEQDSEKTVFRKLNLPPATYDPIWMKSVQEGMSPQGRYSMGWYETHAYRHKRVLSSALQGTILHLQCGTGAWTFLGWMEHGGVWVGIEESLWAAQYAKMTFGCESLHFYRFFPYKTLFEPETFDHAIYLDCFGRALDLHLWVIELQRILKPNGKLFLAAPLGNIRKYTPMNNEGKSGVRELPPGCRWEEWEEEENVVYATLAIR